MKRTATLLFLSALGVGLLLATGSANLNRSFEQGLPVDSMALNQQALETNLASQPLSFEPNRGQTDPQVKFLSRGPGYTFFLTETAVVLSLGQPESRKPGVAPDIESAKSTQYTSAAIKMELVGANPAPVMEGINERPGKSNYFYGNDPEKWRTRVARFGGVKVSQAYPGIDVVYYGTDQRQIEYDFVVAPGADPAAIRLKFDGAEDISLDAEGNLLLSLPSVEGKSVEGELVQHVPVIYQESQGERTTIEGGYLLNEDAQVSFEISNYDPTLPLTIDPTLVYSSYLGGSDRDFAVDIAVDSLGNAIVTGFTRSLDFPVTAGSFQLTNSGGLDVFVTKVSANGSTILYSTYIGSPDFDYATAVDVDSAGNAYVTGDAGIGFPTTPGAFLETGSFQTFLLKLNPTGDSLVYSTYLNSGIGTGIGYDLVIDTSGQAYVSSSGNPDCGPFGGSGSVTKVDSLGASVIYSKLLEFHPVGIDIDSLGNAYLAGTAGPGVATVNAIQPVSAGGADYFIAKLDPTGTNFLFATYLGGFADEGQIPFHCPVYGGGIAVDETTGSVIVFGQTDSDDFPLVKPSQRWPRPYLGFGFLTSSGFIPVTFATKITLDGSAILYSTFLGGRGEEFSGNIALDSTGNTYLTGHLLSDDFPLESPIGGIGTGGFITKLNPEGCRAFSTQYGGNSSFPPGIDVDLNGDAYIAGLAAGGSTPVVNAFQPLPAGLEDGFVAKIGGMPDLVGCIPQPGITALSPDIAQAGDPGFTLGLTGLDFDTGSVVRWDGTDRPTVFVSETEIEAEILASDINITPGTVVPVTVFSPAPGGGVSGPASFLVSSIRPTLTSISPASQPAGGAGFTLTAVGADFQTTARVRWVGIALTTTFVSATELQATVPAKNIITEGIAQVSVFNPDDFGGGAFSNELPFTIGAPGDNPVPAITSLSPANGSVGAASFNLTVNGSGFLADSMVRWNGFDRTTNFVSDAQLQAVILSSDVASGGVNRVTVFNPAPGGGESSSAPFNVINPAPIAVALAPSGMDAGSADFTLNVTGSDFLGSSTVYWQGSARTTTFVSSTELQATVTSDDLSTGGTVEVTVNTPEPGGGSSSALTFTIDEVALSIPAGSSPSATVTAGQAAQYTFTVTPSGSFDQPVIFACSGLPAGTACTFNPTELTPGSNPADVTVTITTTAAASMWPMIRFDLPTGLPAPSLWWTLLGLAIAGLATIKLLGIRPYRTPAMLAGVVFAFVLMTGCGGSAAAPPLLTSTPLGVHTITVTASSGSFTQSLDVTLDVQ